MEIIHIAAIELKASDKADIRIKITKFLKTPTDLKLPGNMLLLWDISLEKSKDVSVSGSIEFAVPRSLMVKEGLDPDKDRERIVMYRYANGEWVELSTKFLKSDEKLNYYVAETDGFSYFAAVVKEIAPAATPTTTPTTTPTSMPAPATTTPASKPIPGFEAPFAIAGLIAIAYLIRRRR